MQNVFLTVSGYIKGESGKERPMNQNQMDFDIGAGAKRLTML